MVRLHTTYKHELICKSVFMKLMQMKRLDKRASCIAHRCKPQQGWRQIWGRDGHTMVFEQLFENATFMAQHGKFKCEIPDRQL